MITREACRGCRDDFYNGRQNFDGGDRCWSAKDGTMVTRYQINWWTQPGEPGAYTEVTVPSCYHQPGVAAYQKELPAFVDTDEVHRPGKPARRRLPVAPPADAPPRAPVIHDDGDDLEIPF